MRSPASTVSVCLLSAAVGCGADGSSGDDEGAADASVGDSAADDGGDGSGTSSGDDGADGTGDGGSGTTTSAGDGADDGGTGDPTPARGGIVITRAIADQGVSVLVGRDGMGTTMSERVTRLIQNRATLIRAMIDVPDDWQSREIRGRVTLTYPDGTTEAAFQGVMVTADSAEPEVDTQFFWYLPAELVLPGMEYAIELEEREPGHENDPAGDVEPRMPYTGSAPVGVEDTYMVMRVLLIPVKHELSGRQCSDAPVPTASQVEAFRAELLAFNPTETVEVQVRDTYTWSQSMGDFGPLLSALAQLRSSDGASAELYYYGLVKPCDGGPMGVGGQAIGIPTNPTMGNAWQRTSLGRFDASMGSGVSTFVHEVGHTQGRRHIACSGDEGGPDPSYPHQGGEIGSFGFNIESWTLMPPTLKDYMTYCGPTWVGDWGWNKVFPIIETLSSWDMGSGQADEPGSSILIGAMYGDGRQEWWTSPGSVSDDELTPGFVVEIESKAGTTVPARAMIARRPDSDTYNVAMPLPPDLSNVSALHVALPGDAKTATVPVSAIRVLHPR